ncbi:MAG: hypothetical protein ACLFWD_03060 [Anaerolineales bacterium]
MPKIKSDPSPEEEKDQAQKEQEEGISEEERERILSEFEAKIEAGDWGGRPFHNVVKEELYPLLGEEELAETEFTRLVQKWASKNYPHDWNSRSTIFDHPPTRKAEA